MDAKPCVDIAVTRRSSFLDIHRSPRAMCEPGNSTGTSTHVAPLVLSTAVDLAFDLEATLHL
jgi:hypothetical protein